MPLDAHTIGNAVASVCESAPVRLAYLHGSYAGGDTDGESDIDIAVLADPSLDGEKRFELRLDLFQKFAEALKVPMEKVDAVVLQDAPALIAYNAVRKGICIFERDRSERNLFELKVEQEYDDERFYLRRDATIVLNRALALSPP